LNYRNPSLIDAFKNAFHGIAYVFKTQRNAKIHTLITILVLLLGIFFKLMPLQWVAIVISIGVVWATECLNTAIEKLTDLASPEYHILAKIAKDCAASSVLVASITAAIVGLIIFIPKLIIVFRSIF
jgi:diacylglycerol kinase (ATP)